MRNTKPTIVPIPSADFDVESSRLLASKKRSAPVPTDEYPAWFKKACDGDLTGDDLARLGEGFVRYAAERFDDGSRKLSVKAQSYLFDIVAPYATRGLAFVRTGLERGRRDDWWLSGRALRRYADGGAVEEVRDVLTLFFEGPRDIGEDDWVFCDIFTCAIGILPDEQLLKVLNDTLKKLPPKCQTEHSLFHGSMPLVLATDPLQAVDEVCSRFFERGQVDCARWLIALSDIPSVRGKFQQRLLSAVEARTSHLKHSAVLAALARLDVTADQLQLTPTEAHRFLAAKERVTEVCAWLTANGFGNGPADPRDVQRRIEESGALDTACEARAVQLALEAVHCGVSIDTESGNWPVPYDGLFAKLMILMPSGLGMHAHLPNKSGEPYRLMARGQEAAAKVQFVSASDYYDMAMVMALLNDVLMRGGAKQRMFLLSDRSQCVFVFCATDGQHQLLLSRYPHLKRVR